MYGPQNHTAIPIQALPIDFIKTKKGILKELILSKASGNVVGVYCPALGEGMFLTVVENIDPAPRSEIVMFNQYDMSGKILNRYEVTLDEIEMVCPMNQRYRHPIFTSLAGTSSTVKTTL